MLFIEYPNCTTCKKAKKFLEEMNCSFVDRNIKEDNPTVEELKLWHKWSGLPLKKFFNTSGKLYQALNLKEKLKTMNEEDMFHLLAGDGMLIKRPIFVNEKTVFVGFKESELKEFLL